MDCWILTFNRPRALNRQIDAFSSWTDVKIFTNHPEVQLTPESAVLHKSGRLPVLYNTLSDPEATSYCARSWNNIFLKGFKDVNEMICVQDDTQIQNPQALRTLIEENKDRFDLIWGPGGDQFFYVKKSVLRRVGWFDERYLGCYCGDADWLKRIWQQYDRSKLSIWESHDWGFVHNPIGLQHIIPTHIGSKAIDPTYVNQDQEIQKAMGPQNRILEHSQAFYCSKWGHMLNGTKPLNGNDVADGSMVAEIDWYPWFTEKYMKESSVAVDEDSFLKRQQRFWGDIANTWSLQNKNPIVGWYSEHQNFPEYDSVLFRDIPLTGNEVILEYGCGPARNIIRFHKRFKRIDGVDIAPECIEKAKINLVDAGVEIPNLWSNDGRSLDMIEAETYDIVFMVISHQHITNRSVRLNLYREFLRVLKPGGYLCFQTGFGPGHPRSVDYFTEHYNNESEFVDKDVRVENVEILKADLVNSGFKWLDHVLTRTCKDEHPQWIWVRCRKA